MIEYGAKVTHPLYSPDGPPPPSLFAERALDEWAYRNGIKLNFIRPGEPIENACIESFNGRFRDECLNTSWFISLKHVRVVIEDWR